MIDSGAQATTDRARWLARLVIERRASRVDIRIGLAAFELLELLPDHPEVAERILAELCARNGLGPVIGLDD
jgi:hypothetical protein